ncbi:divalent-cation tolerance protein CutA [Klebsiella pneumoniae]|uniref:divalent-cation tolerance protein CutA n=1 Tax=Klebsiella pneumoniae TaxID=573 RepID=UPI00294AC6CA|nr:divalent cation tolerance protein CutA [Klebsiella pneumoniae]
MGRARRLSRAARADRRRGPPDQGQPLPYAGERPDLLLHLSRRRQRRAHRHRAGGRARLAACVNLLPGLRSVYRWQRKVEATAEEILLLVKTSAGPTRPAGTPAPAASRTPELLAVEAASGLPEYLQWLATESRPGKLSPMAASTIRLRRWLAGLALLPAARDLGRRPGLRTAAGRRGLRPVHAQATAPDRIEVRWRIADGYYLYRHRTSVKADAAFTGATM